MIYEGKRMQLKKLIHQIEKKLEEKYGEFGTVDIFNHCSLVLTKFEYNFETKQKIGDEVVEIEMDGIKAVVEASIFKTINENIVIFVDLTSVNIEPLNAQANITREI